jgi:stage III sporulation protein SpoIIIAA
MSLSVLSQECLLSVCLLCCQTTLLRDVARLMSLPVSRGGLGMSVVIVDTSNEIAGGLVC